MTNGLSGVVVKQAAFPDRNNERFLATHALTLVLKGSLQVEPRDGGLFQVHAGQAVFLPKGLYLLTDILPDKGSFEAIVYFFEQSLIDTFLHSLPEDQAGIAESPFLLFPYRNAFRSFTENLLELYGNGHPAEREITGPKLLELLHLLRLSKEGTALPATLRRLSRKQRRSLREFMINNYRKPLDIADFAYLTGRSPSTFYRDFKRVFEDAPKHWLIRRRLEDARELLLQGNMNIGEVSKTVGFSDPGHFIKSFRKRWGITPKQLVMQQRAK